MANWDKYIVETKPQEDSKWSQYEVSSVSTAPTEEPKISGVFGSIPQTAYESGERNWMGNIGERPGAVSREAIRANRLLSLAGPFAGTLGLSGMGGERAKEVALREAVNPRSETFQEENLRKFYGNVDKIRNPILRNLTIAGKVIPGMGVSALGMAQDIATDPLQTLLSMTGIKPARDVSGLTRLARTRPVQAVGRFANLPIEKTLPGRVATSIVKSPETVGKGIVRATIPYESVTERGLTKDFKPMLKPEYYQERIPQDIMKRGVDFFKDARKTTGEEISNLIKTNYTDTYIDAKLLQDEARNILGKGIALTDLDISPAQQKLLSRETAKIMGIRGKAFSMGFTEKEMAQTFRKERPISVTDLWQMRKDLDKVIYDTGFSWKPDAIKYLKKLRSILNRPIKSAGVDIEQSFNRYSNIENVFDEIGKSFEGIINKETGEITSPKFATFIQNLMSDAPKSIEIRNMMSQINPQLSEELFNLASAKRLGLPVKDPLERGAFQAMLYPIQRILHPKNIATATAKVQEAGKFLGKFGKFRNPKSPTKGGSLPFKSVGSAGTSDFASDVVPLTRFPRGQFSVKTLSGEKKTINVKPNENIYLTPESKGGKITYQLHDGDVVDVSKNVASDLQGKFGVKQAKGNFAPELEQVEEVVKGKGIPITDEQIKNATITKPKVAMGKTFYEVDVGGKHFSILDRGQSKQELYNKIKEMTLTYHKPDTKFSQYQLPGGENYRELVHENKAYPVEPEEQHFGTGQSWHRVNDRTTPDGEKVYFIEEIQKNKNIEKVPNHPFGKGKYVEFELKKALKEAVDKGYDYISWTTGEQQAARYKLSQAVKAIEWYENTAGRKQVELSPKGGSEKIMVLDVGLDGKILSVSSNTTTGFIGKKLDEVIGKGITEKINASEKGIVEGEGLNIGGEWAKNLYDRQLPNILKDLTKGEVGSIKISGTKWRKASASREPMELTQPALKITPEMKASIRSEKPTYKSLGAAAGKGEEGKLSPTAKGGEIYHGTGKPIEKLSDLSYTTQNYYGQGFYTTDNLNIAEGYSKKGGKTPTIYKVTPNENVKLFDMETKLTPEIKSKITEALGDYSDTLKTSKNLREVFDNVRDEATQDMLPADEIQGIYDSVRANFENMGYGGYEHIGGLKTGKSPHKVKIYWNPEKDIKLSTPTNKTFSKFKGGK